MAVRWNSECFTALEHKDLQANAMAIDNTGTYVLLAGRRYIAIRNLNESDADSVRKFPRQSKYDVSAAEWNPTHHRGEHCVISGYNCRHVILQYFLTHFLLLHRCPFKDLTDLAFDCSPSSNQRLELLTWRAGELAQLHSIRAHTRVITDLNWHRFDPNLLASCSVDTFIHIWDVRDSRKPASSLSAVAEASQVRWNRVSPHILATAHDGDIKLWDQRKGSAPVQYIAAHLSKIHGLDWNPQIETQLATSSQDNTIKFFDTNNPRRAEFVLTTNAPVWRARYTPFGNGLVTVVVPQLRRGENSLFLWNITNRATPMHTFIGHRDVVLEFAWRKQQADDTDFQLVTWSKDQTLLVWRIEPFLQKLCGYDPTNRQKVQSNDNEVVDTNLEKKVLRKAQPLQQEFSLLNVQIPNLEVTKMDAQKRYCTAIANANNYTIILKVTFPNSYPNGVPPTFQIEPGSSVDGCITTQLLQTLMHTAQQRVSKNRTCLEPCLRQFVVALEQLVNPTENNRFHQHTYLEPDILGSFNDGCIPFPRTSGAKFCSVSILVCFGRQINTKKASVKLDTITPRALTALGNTFNKRRTNENMTVFSYYFQKQRSRIKHNNKTTQKALISIYDVAKLFCINKQLAEKYILDGDINKICVHNAKMSESVGRWDLVQAWTLANLIVTREQQLEQEEIAEHPFENRLIQSLINYYASHSDIQMAAMLSCVFGKRWGDTVRRRSILKQLSPSTHLASGIKWLKSGGSPYHTIPPADIVADGWVFPLLRTARSNSLDNLRTEELPQLVPQRPQTTSNYEYYKLMYAEILHRWSLLYNRAEVLKYMCTPEEVHKGVEFLTDCQKCKQPAKHSTCLNCKHISLVCVICHISVRGSANCCIVCGHGGHTIHIQQWFDNNTMCPSGCGCKCLIETDGIFNF